MMMMVARMMMMMLMLGNDIDCASGSGHGDDAYEDDDGKSFQE